MPRRIARRKVSLKYCGCPADAPPELDCRFHKIDEPGWEICPNAKNTNGKVLWGTGYIDIDTGEIFLSLADIPDESTVVEESDEEEVVAETA